MKCTQLLALGASLPLGLPMMALADDGFTINLRGRVPFDVAHIGYDLAGLSDNNSSSEFRTARLGGSRLKFVAEFDFQNSGDIEFRDPRIKGVSLTFKVDDTTSFGLGKLNLGPNPGFDQCWRYR